MMCLDNIGASVNSGPAERTMRVRNSYRYNCVLVFVVLKNVLVQCINKIM